MRAPSCQLCGLQLQQRCRELQARAGVEGEVEILNLRFWIEAENHMRKTLLTVFSNSCSDNRKSKTRPELCRRIENLKWAGFFAIVVAFTVCAERAEAQ